MERSVYFGYVFRFFSTLSRCSGFSLRRLRLTSDQLSFAEGGKSWTIASKIKWKPSIIFGGRKGILFIQLYMNLQKIPSILKPSCQSIYSEEVCEIILRIKIYLSDIHLATKGKTSEQERLFYIDSVSTTKVSSFTWRFNCETK